MKDNIFNYQIKVVEQHLETLWQYTNEWPAPQKEFLDKVLEDLSNTLEELKLAQEELRQQNEELATAQGTVEAERQRYRDLFEFAPDGYLVTDIKGVIHEANRAAATLLNVSQNLLVNTPVFVFVVEADRKGFRTELLRLAELKQVRTWEIQLMRHEGTPFHAAITVAPVYDSGSELVSLRWLLRDITERKRIEGELRKAHNELGIRIQERTAELAKANEALRTEFIERKLVEGALGESEEQHRNLFENVPTGIYRITPDGHILMANPALIRMLGYSSFEELTSRTLENDERFGPAYPQSQFKELEGEVRGLESAWVRRDGTVIFVRENARAIRGEDGAVLYYEGTVEDITERERAEEALRESEERYRTLVEHTYDLITETNIDGRYLYASPKHKDVLGYEPSELVGRNIFEHVHPDDCPAVMAEFQRAIKTLSSGHVVYRYRHKNGQWLWLESAGRPFQTATGEIRAVITSRDITDRKRAEEVLRESFAQLSKKNRYETIISTVTRSVHQSINLQDVLENAVEAMSKNIDRVDNVGIFLVEGEEAVMKANRGYPDWFIERVRRIPYPKDYTWKTIIEGKPRYCVDTDEDTIVGRVGREVGTKSYVSMPIRFEGKTVGAINISSLQKNAFDEEELNLLEIVAQQIEIAINNAQQAEALRESEERFHNMADTAPAMIWMSGSDRLCTYFNKGWLEFTGRAMEEEWGYGWAKGVHSDDLQHCLGTYVTAFDARRDFKMEYRLRRFDGEYRWVLDHGTPRFLPDGSFTGYIGSCIDITDRRQVEEVLQKAKDELKIRVEERTTELKNANERLQVELGERKRAEEQLKASLKEKEVLLKEIHHRVKNNLQVISSLLSLQAPYITDEHSQGILLESRNRIRSMALVHEQLYQAHGITRVDFGGYLRSLVKDLLLAYSIQPNTIKVNLDVKNIFFGIDTAIPCGLLINELISNCLKHAFPKDRKGEIYVTFSQQEGDRYSLIVKDNGVGFPPELNFRNTKSLGLQLVMTLTKQLHGTITLERAKGTAFHITFIEVKYKERR